MAADAELGFTECHDAIAKRGLDNLSSDVFESAVCPDCRDRRIRGCASVVINAMDNGGPLDHWADDAIEGFPLGDRVVFASIFL